MDTALCIRLWKIVKRMKMVSFEVSSKPRNMCSLQKDENGSSWPPEKMLSSRDLILVKWVQSELQFTELSGDEFVLFQAIKSRKTYCDHTPYLPGVKKKKKKKEDDELGLWPYFLILSSSTYDPVILLLGICP